MSESKSLVALAEEAAKIETALIESGGELTPELEAMLADIDVSLPAKVERVAMMIERMATLNTFYKERADFVLKIATGAQRVAERCQENIKLAMLKLETDEIVGVDVRYKLQNTAGKVVIENDENVDPSYTVIEQVTKIDKKRIAEDLKLGVPVRGARLEIGKSLRKYANTPGRK